MRFQSKEAIVTAVTDRHTALVKIEPDARRDCGGCAVAAMCGVGRMTDSLEVNIAPGIIVAPDARVSIRAAGNLTRKAFVLTLLLPLFALLAAISIASLCGASQTVAAGLGLVCLALAFAVLYALRRRIEVPSRWTVTSVISHS